MKNADHQLVSLRILLQPGASPSATFLGALSERDLQRHARRCPALSRELALAFNEDTVYRAAVK
jgi:hypothetical protein